MSNNFGWVNPSSRTEEQSETHDKIMMSLPKFRIIGSTQDSDKAFLSDFGKIANGGKHFPVFYQSTGSCCGCGLGQAIQYLSAVEVVRNGENENPKTPFWLLAYGKGRQLGGLNGRGEGSFGSVTAEAAKRFGFLDYQMQGLPQPSPQAGGIGWGKNAELEWSDGANISQKWLNESKNHLVQSYAKMNSADDVKQALLNGYPCTTASDWGGLMQCPVVDGVLLNRRADTWMHQQMILNFWEHPSLGDIFYILNSWGASAHGTCPSGAPQGGYWLRKQDVEYMVRAGETFAFSQFNGFPSQDLNKMLFRIIGA